MDTLLYHGQGFEKNILNCPRFGSQVKIMWCNADEHQIHIVPQDQKHTPDCMLHIVLLILSDLQLTLSSEKYYLDLVHCLSHPPKNATECVPSSAALGQTGQLRAKICEHQLTGEPRLSKGPGGLSRSLVPSCVKSHSFYFLLYWAAKTGNLQNPESLLKMEQCSIF